MAEDLTAETFLKVVRAADRFDPAQGHAEGLDPHGGAQRPGRLAPAGPAPAVRHPRYHARPGVRGALARGAAAPRGRGRAAARRGRRRWRAADRELVGLRYGSGLDTAEVAQILGISEGSVRTRLWRVLGQAARSAGPMSDDPEGCPISRSWIGRCAGSAFARARRSAPRCSAGCVVASGRRVPPRRGVAVRPSRPSPPALLAARRARSLLRATRPVDGGPLLLRPRRRRRRGRRRHHLRPSAMPRCISSRSTRISTARAASPPATSSGSTAGRAPAMHRGAASGPGDHRALLRRLRRRRPGRRRADRHRRAARPRGHGGDLRTTRRPGDAAGSGAAFPSGSSLQDNSRPRGACMMNRTRLFVTAGLFGGVRRPRPGAGHDGGKDTAPSRCRRSRSSAASGPTPARPSAPACRRG